LLNFPLEKVLDRLEALVAKGLTGDPGARAALLGTEKRSLFPLSKLFAAFVAIVFGVAIIGYTTKQEKSYRPIVLISSFVHAAAHVFALMYAARFDGATTGCACRALSGIVALRP
jgi:ABC-type transport system involved in cytochrome c biogenesis permease subunit